MYRSAGLTNVIVCVHAEIDLDVIPDDVRVVRYADRIDPEQVLAVIDPQHGGV